MSAVNNIGSDWKLLVLDMVEASCFPSFTMRQWLDNLSSSPYVDHPSRIPNAKTCLASIKPGNKCELIIFIYSIHKRNITV